MISCSEEESSQQEDFIELNGVFESIQEAATSKPCIDATQWSFIPYGQKACGGPQGFIAYPLSIDTVAFFNRIEGHRLREAFLNEKWAVFSACDVPPQPQSVDCENGLPVLIY